VSSSPERFSYLRRSIECYLAQTYPRRELIIVCGGPKRYAKRIERYAGSLRRPDIRVVHLAGRPTLGRLRNETLALARGKILCQWDDDDLSHPRRLALQHEALAESGAAGVILDNFFQYFEATGEIFVVLLAGRNQNFIGHTGTIMFRSQSKVRYLEMGERSMRHEDMDFFLALRQVGPLAVLAEPGIFLYVYHGKNTFDRAHHRRTVEKAARSASFVRRNRRALEALLAAYPLDRSKVRLVGREERGP
jgi:glycosyltransferase involved in cell wall biosynthesis